MPRKETSAKVRVYQYPRCSTCRKALAWLKEQGVEYTAIDIVQAPPSADELRQLMGRSGVGVKKLFNTSGEVYREQGYKTRLASMNEAEALDALAANGKLIKRPLVTWDGGALVGFDPAAYAKHFGKETSG